MAVAAGLDGNGGLKIGSSGRPRGGWRRVNRAPCEGEKGREGKRGDGDDRPLLSDRGDAG
jgi:hypothetical protein